MSAESPTTGERAVINETVRRVDRIPTDVGFMADLEQAGSEFRQLLMDCEASPVGTDKEINRAVTFAVLATATLLADSITDVFSDEQEDIRHRLGVLLDNWVGMAFVATGGHQGEPWTERWQ